MADIRYKDIAPIQVLYFQHRNGLPILTYNMGFLQGPVGELVSAFTSAISAFLSHYSIGLLKRISFKKYEHEFSILFFTSGNIIMVVFLSSLSPNTIFLLDTLFKRINSELDFPDNWGGENSFQYTLKIKNIIYDVFQIKKMQKEIESAEKRINEIIAEHNQYESEVEKLLKMTVGSPVGQNDYSKKIEKLRKKMEALQKEYMALTGDPIVPTTYYERKILLDLDIKLGSKEEPSESSKQFSPDIRTFQEKLSAGLGVKKDQSAQAEPTHKIVAELESSSAPESLKPQKEIKTTDNYELNILKKKLISLIRDKEKEV